MQHAQLLLIPGIGRHSLAVLPGFAPVQGRGGERIPGAGGELNMRAKGRR